MAMASEGLTCSICFERFDDQTFCPRLLSCGHSFCSGCLERLLDGNTINCPTCRIAVSVPAGVTGLIKNFALLEIVNATPKHARDGGSQLCETCDGEHPATFCCLDCKEDMCKVAAGFHTRNKSSRKHNIVSLEPAAVSIFCPEHNEQFRLFDEDCGHVVCKGCITDLKHNRHKCLSLTEAASKCRQEIEARVTKVSSHSEEIKAADTRVSNAKVDMKNACEEQAVQIRGMFKTLHAALIAREKVLINKLDQLHKNKAVILTEQLDSLSIFQARLESTVQSVMSTIHSSGNAELLVARSDIESMLEAIESQFPVLDPEADFEPEFTVDRGELLIALNNAGIVSDKSTCAKTTTTTGLGLRHAQPGEEASFIITAHDVHSRWRGVGGDVFLVELKEEEGKMKVGVNVKDKGDGTYLATYTAPIDAKRGNYTLSVRLRGASIKGSPFVLRVGDPPVGKVSCYSCGRKTRSMFYYINDNEPDSSDRLKVYGYSALCYPKCFGYANKHNWIFVCGPC